VGPSSRYQSFMFPVTAATDASASSAVVIRERTVPPRETNGDSKRITLKGDVQPIPPGNPRDLRGNIERWFQAFFGLESAPVGRDCALVGYTGWLVVLLLAWTTAVLLSRAEPDATLTWPLVALAVSALIAEMQSVRLTSRASVSVSSLPIVLAAVIYGPLAAIIVSAASLLCDFRTPYARWLTWTSSRSIAAGCAGVVAFKMDGTGAHGFGPVVAAVGCAMLVEQVGEIPGSYVVGAIALFELLLELGEGRETIGTGHGGSLRVVEGSAMIPARAFGFVGASPSILPGRDGLAFLCHPHDTL